MDAAGTSSLRSFSFRFATLLLVCMATLCASAWTPADGPPSSEEISLSVYKAELDRCAAALKNPEQLAQVKDSLPRAWIVQTPQGRVAVPTQQLLASLYKARNSPKDAAAASREIAYRLQEMKRAAEELESDSAEDSSTQARARLENILNRREFGGAKGPSALQLFMTRLEQRIFAWLVRLFSHLDIGRSTGSFLTWGVAALAILALGWWAYSSISGVRRRPVVVAQIGAVSAESRAWAADALAAAERGDYREAVHCAYWAAIVRLEGLGLLKEDRARTPRESLRLLARHPDEQQSLGNLTRHFELIWYGYRPASAQDWSAARTLLERMGCLTALTEATASS